MTQVLTFGGKAKTEYDEHFEREVAAYEALWPKLRQTHTGRWVAVRGGRVIDSDEDRDALMKRVRARFPREVVYFEQVLPDRLHRVVDIPGIDSA
jgi:hypothetical protein